MESIFPKNGLSEQQVLQSRQQHGANILTPPEKKPAWKLFLEKFSDPIIRVLLVALGLSISVSCYQFLCGEETAGVFLEPAGILVAILLATGVGFYFEQKAGKKFDILNQVNDEVEVKVIRNGNVREISRRELVVGDIVLLETGNEVPADGKLLQAVAMQVNESSLTGEPIVSKTARAEELDPEATYPGNRVLRGTTVSEGYGTMEVDTVGDATEYGKVYTGAQIENDVKTPLNLQLEKLSRIITWASYTMALLIVAGRMLMLFTSSAEMSWIQVASEILNTFMLAVAVVVATIPEGLPMSVVLSLALSMKRMLESHNLVRKMHACETMGACTVICTDKTGTLTRNQMRVSRTQFLVAGDKDEGAWTLGNDDAGKLIKESICCNTTAFLDKTETNPKVVGNPTEGALLLWLEEKGIDYAEIRHNAGMEEQLTFSTERKYMATKVASALFEGKHILYVKGAPEIVLEHCTRVRFNGNDESVTGWKAYIEKNLLEYQSKAMRTLGFAYAELDTGTSCFENGKLRADLALTFLGFAGISDPVREDVPFAIQSCADAGIDVKIVTGDTPATATEIATQIGLWTPNCKDTDRITGPEFAALSDSELQKRIMGLKIIARARPGDKERLVKLLQAQGQVVAVTGDGTNDAPALNAAQVGLSMGDGTSVAKEASDITIMDNRFGSIVSAVMWGRSLYRNIQRFILFQLTVSLIASLVVLIGAFSGSSTPLTITQMLWVNLIMDTFAAMALASLPPDAKVMQDKPRKVNAHILTAPMAGRIFGVGLLLLAVLFGFMQYLKYEDIESLRQFSLYNYGRDFFRFGETAQTDLTRYERTLFFTFFVMLQLWNMFNAKAFMTARSAFSHLGGTAKGFLAISLLILLGQIAIVNIGGEMFSVQGISLFDWTAIILASSLVLWIGEAVRLVKRIIKNQNHER